MPTQTSENAETQSAPKPAESIVRHDVPCERCQKLTLFADEANTYYQYGTLQNLAASSCRVCAMIMSVRRSFCDEDDIEPSLEEIIVFVEHIPPAPFGKPRAFEVLFYDSARHLRWDFRFLTIGAPDSYDIEMNAFHETYRTSSVLKRYDRAKSWLEGCQESHQCQSDTQEATTTLPTRLLEITSDKVRLVSTVSLPPSTHYMTLSHMWGAHPEDQLQLIASRFADLSVNIPMHEMSAIFVEAVELTRHLGYRYLWIDSLCIFQDSEEDWEKEASSMSDVYRNSVCNLAFLFPPSDKSSKYWNVPDTRRPCTLLVTSASQVALVIKPLYPEPNDVPKGTRYWHWLTPSEWPLFSRAWAFQEHLLARRTILYGRGNMLWQCSRHYCDESLGQVTRGKDHSLISKIQLSDSQIDLAPVWLDMLQDYRSRHLTKFEDRAMALAGTARMFCQTHHCTYLAGHLAEHMPHSLLWEMSGVKETDSVREPPLANAPSWSCFSVPLHTRELIDFGLGNYDSTRPFLEVARLMAFRWLGQLPTQKPYWGFYSFSGLRLELKVMVLLGTVNYSADGEEGVKLSKPSPLDEGVCIEHYNPDVRDMGTTSNLKSVLDKKQSLRTSIALQSLFATQPVSTRRRASEGDVDLQRRQTSGRDSNGLSGTSADDLIPPMHPATTVRRKTEGDINAGRYQSSRPDSNIVPSILTREPGLPSTRGVDETNNAHAITGAHNENAHVDHVLLAVLRIYERSGDIWLNGLALTLGSEDGTWRRVGYWTCAWIRTDEDENHFTNATKVIERLRASNTRTITLV